MGPLDSHLVQKVHLGQAETDKDQFRYNSDTGLRFKRVFSNENRNPFEEVDYERRQSVIREPDGTVVFEMKDLEIPTGWSQVATDIIAQKYFRKTGVPQYYADGQPKLTNDGKSVLGPETSVKQTIHRLAGTWRYWGEKYGYFASPEDGQFFYDEIVVMMLKQMAAPNSPQWFNTGLYWAYGINGPAQGHYYVDPDTAVLTKSTDAYSHPQPHACGRYNTKLFTSRGVLNLGEVVEEKMTGIKVFDGEKFVEVKAVKNNGVKKVYRAILKNGNYLDFTDDHLIYVSATQKKSGGEYEWKELKQILAHKVKQVALAPAKSSDSVSQKKLDQAALAGWVVGDGYYNQYGKDRRKTVLEVSTIDDDEYKKMTGLFSRLFGKYTTQTRKSIESKYRLVCLDSKAVNQFVQAFDLVRTPSAADVPGLVRRGTKEEKIAFLQALFQASGDVHQHIGRDRNDGEVVLFSPSLDLIHSVQVLLLGLGIYSNVTVSRSQQPERKVGWRLFIALGSEREKFENLIGFVSRDKREKLAKLNKKTTKQIKSLVSEETVVAIEYLGEEEVYDIQTASGRFAANGVIVHNCFIQAIKDDLVNDGGIMDLWVREARLFKYGSGTGTNFSSLRGRGEPLAGGGVSSGLMSWLRIGDRAAGAIKSGGTTRRAAKMVVLDLDHPDIETFVNWKVNEEKKVAALIAAGYSSDYESEAYQTVSGQNSNNSVRVPHRFMQAVQEDGSWNLTWRTDGSICRTLKAKELWNQIAFAAWACADPGVQYDGTINDWHTCPQSGRINASNPCSEYMFVDNTACNLASLNLVKFFDARSQTFLIEEFKQAVRIWTVILEISVLMAQFPSKEIAQNSYDFRTLGLGYANIGSVMMMMGVPYESPEATSFAGTVSALMTAESYKASAEMAKHLGPFPKFEYNRSDMLRVIRNHRRAAFHADDSEYEKLTVVPKSIDPNYAPAYLLAAARESWNEALAWGEQHGYRNAQTTLLAPTGTIGLLMDCATTGVEPDFALVKFKKLAGGGYFRIVNESVPVALENLGYKANEITDILNYLRGTADITNAPGINAKTLGAKGFSPTDLSAINKALAGAFELKFVFNVWTLGEDCLKRLGFTSERYNDPNFNLLSALGFTDEQIDKANEYVCGVMTIEGAPHLRPEHYPVFDTANRNGKKGQRFIHYLGHVKMMAAVQPFLSGAISKTINMPHEATLEDVKFAYEESWRLGLKAVALYRDGCKLSQPLSTSSSKNKSEEKKAEEKENREEEKVVMVKEEQIKQLAKMVESDDMSEAIRQASQILSQHVSQKSGVHTPMESYGKDGQVRERRVYLHGEKRAVPAKRGGITVSAKVGQQQLWLRTGEYPDGRLAEVFVDMYKEGATVRSLLNMFAIAVSMGLQYGVPLEKYVENFTFTRFEPAGFTDHPNIKNCTSVIDFVFRVLGMEYLGRMDFVQVPPKGIQKKKFENLAKLAEGHLNQNTIDLAPVTEIEIQAPAEDQATLPNFEEEKKGGAVDSMDRVLEDMMGDAPACPTCGHVTVRNGSCYKCLNCGDSLGCS